MTKTRLTIWIKANKNGKLRATYWSMATARWLPIQMAEAELLLAQDLADRKAT